MQDLNFLLRMIQKLHESDNIFAFPASKIEQLQKKTICTRKMTQLLIVLTYINNQ